MIKPSPSLLLLASVAATLILIVLVYNIKWPEDLQVLHGFPFFGLDIKPPNLFPYHHLIDQMEWITEFATNKVCFTVPYHFLSFDIRIRRAKGILILTLQRELHSKCLNSDNVVRDFMYSVILPTEAVMHDGLLTANTGGIALTNFSLD